MSSPKIPTKPIVTPADLKALCQRTKEALAAKGVSQRQAEVKIGMAAGTISKLFKGKIALTLTALKEIAAQAGVGPEKLVAGTALAHLLLEAPTTPESEELTGVYAQLDELRAELAARDATILTVEQDKQASRVQSERLARQLTSETKKRESVAKTLEDERAQLATVRAAARASEFARATEVMAHVQTKARLAEAEKQVGAWRDYALSRHQRVEYLETVLAQQLAAAQQQSAGETGRLLLTAIAGLGIGAYIGNQSSPVATPRRLPARQVASRQLPASASRRAR